MQKRDKYNHLDITNKRYGKLVAIKKVGKSKWLFHCDCGNEIILNYSRVLYGQKSCGCLAKECRSLFGDSHKTHGQSKTKLYRKWRSIISRCYDPNNKGYKRYGGRGITMCDEWKNSFEVFAAWAFANGYDPNKNGYYWSIDRINNNKGYCPDNCRFTTAREQALNRDVTTVYEYRNQEYTASEFADVFGIEKTFVYRKVKSGETLEQILQYWNKAHSVPDTARDVSTYAKEKNVTVTTVNRWIKQGKVNAEKYGRKWYILRA